MALSKVGGPARVLIRSIELVTREFETWTMHAQAGVLLISEDERMEIALRIDVENGEAAYPPGTYVVGAKSFRTNDYGALVVSKKGIVLIPESAAQPAGGWR